MEQLSEDEKADRYGLWLLLDGFIYSLASFGIVLMIFFITNLTFHNEFIKYFFKHTSLVIATKWLLVIILSSLFFMLVAVLRNENPRIVFVQTLVTGATCGLLVVVSFFLLFKWFVSLDDIFFGILKLLSWKTKSRHFIETLIAFGSVFLIAYPILFISVKYFLNRIFWQRKNVMVS
jgi:hypothetical protein